MKGDGTNWTDDWCCRPLPASTSRGLRAAITYGVVSSAVTFANKGVSQTFHFNHPAFLIWLQMLLTALGLTMLGAAKLIAYPQISRAGLRSHAPVAVLYSINSSLALAALQNLSIPTYGVLKRAGPLFVLLLQFAAKYRARKELGGKHDHHLELAAAEEGAGAPRENRADGEGPGVVAGVFVIVIGAFVASASDLYLSAPALMMGIASNVTQSLYHLLVESKHKGREGIGREYDYGTGVDPTVGLLAYNSLLSLPIIAIIIAAAALWLGAEELGFLDPSRYTWKLIAAIGGNVALGCALQYTMFVSIDKTSALTTALVGHAKTTIQTLLAFFVLAQDVSVSMNYILGIICSIIGGYLFSMAKYQQSLPLGPGARWTWPYWSSFVLYCSKFLRNIF